MQRRAPLTIPCVLLTACGLLLGAGPAPAADEIITLGAGNVVGVYYAAGSGMAKIFNKKRGTYRQWLVPVATPGTVANISSVIGGSNQFGLAQLNMLEKSIRGTDPGTTHPGTNLVAVLGLYSEALTIVAAGDAGVERLADLKGKRVNIGAPGSSTHESALPILARAGLQPSDLKLNEEPSFKASDLLEEGRIDAYFFTAGHPNLSVREATSGKRKAVLLPVGQDIIDYCLALNPNLKAVSIETDYYPALINREPVPTVGTKVILFARGDRDAELVYRLVKEVMTNLDLFRRQQPALSALTAKDLADVAGLPMHPGARRYFREVGLLP
jgi:hypothetical protein